MKRGFKPDAIFADYIGIMAPCNSNKNDNSYSSQKKITEEIRGLAVELGIPIISAVQTGRSGVGKDELDLTNVSDSIGTAFTADVMIGVSQPEGYKESGKYRWTLLKNRYGQNKIGVNIKVNYARMRLLDDGIAVDEEDNKDLPTIGKKKTAPKEQKEVKKVESDDAPKKSLKNIEY